MDAMAASHGAVRAVSDDEILDAYRFLAAHEGVFCEPASAAGVAGLLKHGAEGARRVACVLTGHGLKDPQTALAQRRLGRAVRAGARRGRARRPGMSTAPVGPRPRLLGQPRAGVRRAGLRARRCTSSSRWWRPGASRSRPTSRSRATAATSRVRGFERCTRPTGSSSASAPTIPLSGGLGTSAAAIVAGLLAADSMYELDADLLAHATRLEGHPDNVAAALLGGFVLCAGRRARSASTCPPGWRRCSSSRTSPSAPRAARAALPPEVPMADAVFNVAHAGLLVLGLARGDWDLVARGLDDRLHQPHREHLYPRSMELVRRARSLGALGRDDLRRGADRARLVRRTTRRAPSSRARGGVRRVGRRAARCRSPRRGADVVRL